MLRRTNFGTLVDDLGTSSEDEKALAELIKIAESVGMEIIENKTAISIKFCLEVMKRLQKSERIAPCGDTISRQAAIKETLKHTMTSRVTNQGVWNECVQAIADTLANAECLPSVQPKVVPIAEIRFDDDKLHEIVDEAIKDIEIKYGWTVVKWHNITEEEREREGYPEEWLTIVDCQMPDDDEEILVTVKDRNGNPYVEADTCFFDGTYYSLDSGYDWMDDVIAWMPLPEPYKAESEGL